MAPVRKGVPKARTEPKVVEERQGTAPTHVLMRVRSEGGLTVEAHSTMIAEHGVAMFGKRGVPMGVDSRNTINRQIADGTPTYLFVTTREGWNGEYVTYRCRLRKVLPEVAPDQLRLVPRYYVSEARKVATWFEIASFDRLSREEMNSIFVKSSGRSIMSVIKSSATLFHVGLGTPAISQPIKRTTFHRPNRTAECC